MAYKTPEYVLVGCLLNNPQATLDSVSSIVSANEFRTNLGKAVYTAAEKITRDGKTPELALFEVEIKELGFMVSPDELKAAYDVFVSDENVIPLAEAVHKEFITDTASAIGIQLADKSISPLDAVAKLQETLNGSRSILATPCEAATGFYDFITAAAQGNSKPFLKTGIQSLDNLLGGGLVASGLITLAARPATGKTTVALNIAESVAAAGNNVLIESLEMDSNQLWARRVGIDTGLSYNRIYRGDFPANDTRNWARISASTNKCSRRGIIINDKPVSVEDIEYHLRSNKNINLVIIDHIGLIRPSIKATKYEQMTDISHKLKQLALSTRVPILALSQLNRESEHTESKEPSMANLRDTGAIEEDSDAVIVLHRPRRYDSNCPPVAGAPEDIYLKVDKNRHGATGKIAMSFYGLSAQIKEKRGT